ncbi:MAG TPA: nuclear transport factor 2 family protein [Steroidobacteraceae bacterium]|nr:nuclear transport factor 2 family protein [Steroidobacteraceae bacterium]
MRTAIPTGRAALALAMSLAVPACVPQTMTTPQARGQRAVLERQVEFLSAEAQRLQDASDIKRLQRAWGYYVQSARWDDAVDLFTDDASLEMGLDGVYRGRARIRAYLYALGGGHEGITAGELNEQFLIQPVIDVAADGRTALGRWRRLMMLGHYGSSASWGEGPFEIKYVRQDGVWKISSLHWYQTYVVPYQGGWQSNPDENGARYVSAQLPPDAPPTESYGTWPAVYRPPYHYPNPATVPPPPSAPQPGDATGGDPAVAQLQQAAVALQRRVDRLRDAEQIENLVSIYGYYLDKQQWGDLTALFADDGQMEISLRGIYVGHASIRRALELFGPQDIRPDHLHNHIQVQPEIDVAADGLHAWSRTRAISQLCTYGQVGIWGDGVYENEYVKVDGVWRIARDHIYTGFFATYDKGWLSAARPAPGISAKIPPDLPPSEHYQTYPEPYIPPFHARNPVTGNPVDGASRAALPAAAPGDFVTAIPAAGPAPERAALLQIDRRVTRLEDERAIENLQRTFGFYMDKALWRDTADLFTADGTLELGGGGVYVGRDHILAYLTSIAPHGLTYGHMFSYVQEQPIITLSADGRTARGHWHFLAELGEWKHSATWGAGSYENEYQKVNGVWRIRAIHRYDRMFTPYVDGWAKTALPLSGPDAVVPPDRPPTVHYRSYPAAFTAPLGFVNPVTGR